MQSLWNVKQSRVVLAEPASRTTTQDERRAPVCYATGMIDVDDAAAAVSKALLAGDADAQFH